MGQDLVFVGEKSCVLFRFFIVANKIAITVLFFKLVELGYRERGRGGLILLWRGQEKSPLELHNPKLQKSSASGVRWLRSAIRPPTSIDRASDSVKNLPSKQTVKLWLLTHTNFFF